MEVCVLVHLGILMPLNLGHGQNLVVKSQPFGFQYILGGI